MVDSLQASQAWRGSQRPAETPFRRIRDVRIETMVTVFVNTVFLAMLSGATMVAVALFFP